MVRLALYAGIVYCCMGSSTSSPHITPPSSRVVISGVTLEREKQSDDNGSLVRLNGTGIRSISLLGWEFEIYVAGLYTETPLDSPQAVDAALRDDETIQFDFTFLRSVPQERVAEAWKRQLDHSVDYEYPGYQRDRAQFIGMFGKIEHLGTESVVLRRDETIIVDQGEPKGSIKGKDFQKAFCSMWFGSKPVADDLKKGLLLGDKDVLDGQAFAAVQLDLDGSTGSVGYAG